MQMHKSYVSPFFYHSNSLWVVYFTNVSDSLFLICIWPCATWLPLLSPLLTSHFSRPSVTTLSHIWQPSYRSLLPGPLPFLGFSPPWPLVHFHRLLSIPELWTTPRAQPSAHHRRTYLILWLLFYISRPILLNPGFSPEFPVIYWTFPVHEPL